MGLFGDACISKNVKWLLVDIGEKFHSFIKKHSISALTTRLLLLHLFLCYRVNVSFVMYIRLRV